MIPDTSSIAGYTIFREEPNDPAPDLSSIEHTHPLGKSQSRLNPATTQLYSY